MRLPRGLRGALAAARAQEGYTLVELLAVLVILITVVTSLTGLFVSAARAELDESRRFAAQQIARTAVDRMRREIHCASEITVASASSVTVTLPPTCPSTGGVQMAVVYDTELVSTGRYRVRRAGVHIADHVTTGDVFSYVAPSPASLGKLRVQLPVNVTPNEGWRTWRLDADIVLRNTTRN